MKNECNAFLNQNLRYSETKDNLKAPILENLNKVRVGMEKS